MTSPSADGGLLGQVQAAYDASATAWGQGPAATYDALADELVAASTAPLAGARVLDLGAGTGAGSRAARRAGATWVVAADAAAAMLRAGSGWSCALVADAAALPFRPGSLDLVVAAFCLGHLPDPGAALAQARTVAPALLASAFEAGWTHPAKALVDEVLSGYGFVRPAWYEYVKAHGEPAVQDPDRLRALAEQAGYRRVEVSRHRVDVGVRTPVELAGWRLGMAHVAPFVASLDLRGRERLRHDCEATLVGAPPLVVAMLVLSASTAP